MIKMRIAGKIKESVKQESKLKVSSCPYCKKELDKAPAKKKKCPSCGDFIYVRDGQLFTEKEKEKRDFEQLQEFDPDFALAKKELTIQFGREPPINDVQWMVFNQRIIEYASKRQWGLYRNNTFAMASLLMKEGRNKQTLGTLLEVCYLDLNGGHNVTISNGIPLPNGDILTREMKDFDPSLGFLAPAVLDMVLELQKDLKISNAELEAMFLKSNIVSVNGREQTVPLRNMPLSVKDAWTKLREEFTKRQEICTVDISNYKEIFQRVLKCLKNNQKDEAIELIKRITIFYSSKKRNIPNHKAFDSFVRTLLKSDDRGLLVVSESLLLTLIKKDKEQYSDLARNYIKHISKNIDCYVESHIIGKLGLIEIEWIKEIIPTLKKKIKSDPEWNVRRFAAFNLGTIGKKYPNLVKDIIPTLTSLIKDPYGIAKKEKIKTKAMLIEDPILWLKDAYIDTLGMITAGDKKLIQPYKLLLENIVKKDKNPYSKKKAQKVLDMIS